VVKVSLLILGGSTVATNRVSGIDNSFAEPLSQTNRPSSLNTGSTSRDHRMVVIWGRPSCRRRCRTGGLSVIPVDRTRFRSRYCVWIRSPCAARRRHRQCSPVL